MPNTHRRRRRDATVELSRVGVGGVNTVHNIDVINVYKRFFYFSIKKRVF